MRAPSKSRRLSGLFFIAVVLGTANAHAQSEPTIKGIVRTKSGYPLARAPVTLFSDDRVRNTVTNKVGEFEFTSLPLQAYELQASFIGYMTGIVPGLRPGDQNANNLTISLEPLTADFLIKAEHESCPETVISALPGTYEQITYNERNAGPSLVGSVRAMLSRRGALKDVELKLTNRSDPSKKIPSIRSDDRGEFHFNDLEPGKYSLKLSLEDFYEGSTMDFWVTRENTTRIGRIGMWNLGWQDLCGGSIVVLEPEVPTPAMPPEIADPWPYPLSRVNPHLLRPLSR
jgi:hypothetical protein